ncbi:MAG: 2-C-methyl-D-erythritol 2,4-cyclodiphosphate synthase [Magnetococcales bacterium]|nr:2-C-methyl-D-erythritol 2,4-cyclodiphosphate synthase [Magnetococcales bacterium]
MSYRIGQGFDVHRWVTGRPLILGGVTVPHSHGLEGHSDADVLIHAIIDALLGAAGLGDIGRHFPDSDPQYKGIDSGQLLDRVRGMLAEKGWKVENIDATLIGQKPRMAPHIPLMEARLAALLAIEVMRINVKATTTEGLGFTGRQEGLAAMASALLYRDPPGAHPAKLVVLRPGEPRPAD